MRALLAFSSLHIARKRPDDKERYESYSVAQHQAALRLATTALTNITSETCTPLHLFSIMTGMYALGRPRKLDEFVVVGESGIAQWLVLFRGTTAIIDTYKGVLALGPLAPLFRARYEREVRRSRIVTSDLELMGDLLTLVSSSSTNQSELKAYTKAIKGLEQAWQFMQQCPTDQLETGDVFIWLFRLSDEYLTRLRDGTQEALTIFAYSCLLFKKLEGLWWIEGWSNHLMSNIYEYLDEEHRGWIQLPIREIGWVPAS